MAEQGNAVIQDVISQWLGDGWRTLGDLAGQTEAEPKLHQLQTMFPDMDIPQLSRDELVDLFERRLWVQIQGDDIQSPKIAEVLFRTALILNLHNAINLAQKVIGHEITDGIMGPRTLQAINGMSENEFTSRYNNAVIDFVNTNKSVPADVGIPSFVPQFEAIQHAEDTDNAPLDDKLTPTLEGFEVDAIAKKSTSDIWTTDDQLGYASYAQAIAKMIIDNKAEPPLTISIQAPWGQGKTSLMRMIQDKLKHGIADKHINEESNEPHTDQDDNAIPGIQTKLNNIKDWIKQEKTEEKSPHAMLSVEKGTIPCVWFNPLYFQNSNQVWSGLAHAILHQLVDKLPNQLQKERFWFRLCMTRINTQAVRRQIHRLMITRLIPKGLIWSVILVLMLVAAEFSNVSLKAYLNLHTWLHGVPVFIAFAAQWALAYFKQNKNWALDDKLAKYIQEPDYESNLGLLHLVDHDLDRALELLLGKDGRLCVFIDDLDRCTPATVNDILLAINQFISVQHRKLYFILGMDTHMVAMAIETAADKQAEAYKKTQHTSKSYGWRFMEKFIQLPFFIPRIQLTQAQNYMESLLREKPAQRIEESTIAEIKDKIAESVNPKQVQQIVTHFKREHKVDVIPELDASVAAKLIDMTSDRSSETYKKLIDVAFADLELNPREIKRFLNIARLLFIRLDRESDVGSEEHMRKVVRASHLILNWPQCLRWLQGNARSYTVRGDQADPVQNLEDLLDNPGINDFTQWQNSITATWGEDIAEIVAVSDFYTFCKRIHADPPNLRAIFAASIF